MAVKKGRKKCLYFLVSGEDGIFFFCVRQAIRLAELLRYELGLVISPREILGSPDVAALVQGLQAQGRQERMKSECGWSS